MTTRLNQLLKSNMINGWPLFWLVTLPVSVVVMLNMRRADLSEAETVSSMIQLSVRNAVPYLYFAFAASSLNAVLPGSFSRWLLRNRRIIGLCFAAAMAWQLLFIVWLVALFTDYYVAEIYVFGDVVEGMLGYAFLIAMVLTSFRFGRKRLTGKQWKWLHRGGIYWLWMYAWSTYWFELFYYAQPADFIDYVFYWAGLLAWGFRLLGFSKRRLQQSSRQAAKNATGHLLLLGSGMLLVAIGMAAASFGSAWSPQVYALLFSFKFVVALDTFAPYLPLVPFYPMFLMASGAAIIVHVGWR